MSRGWNGLDLQNELAALLGDESTTFKARVLGWLNDIQIDITSRHDWTFLRHKGKRVLTASQEEHNLYIAAPGAPSAAIAAGGSLTDGSTYNVLITFVESASGAESLAGTASSSVVADSTNKTINLTGIPTSSEPLVTGRKIYLKKDSGEYLLSATISDNTTTTASITADTSSTVEPPDYTYIRKIDGSPYFETGPSRWLEYMPLDQLRLLFSGTFSTGNPDYWADMGHERVVLYPTPSSAYTMSFYYYRQPKRIYADASIILDIPPWLKPALKAGVIAMGEEYRDRDGQESKRSNYEQVLREIISRTGSPISAPTRVRDVIGSNDGWAL